MFVCEEPAEETRPPEAAAGGVCELPEAAVVGTPDEVPDDIEAGLVVANDLVKGGAEAVDTAC